VRDLCAWQKECKIKWIRVWRWYTTERKPCNSCVLDWLLSPTPLEQCDNSRAYLLFEDSNGQRYKAYRNGRHRNYGHLKLIMASQAVFRQPLDGHLLPSLALAPRWGLYILLIWRSQVHSILSENLHFTPKLTWASECKQVHNPLHSPELGAEHRTTDVGRLWSQLRSVAPYVGIH
jgi:hypothetical protein